MPVRFLGALAILIVFSILMGRKSRKQQNAVWTGVITDIKHQRTTITRDEDRGPQDQVTILYRTDEGKNGKLKLRMETVRQFLPAVQPGDRLVKRQGTYLPRRAELVGDTASTDAPAPDGPAVDGPAVEQA